MPRGDRRFSQIKFCPNCGVDNIQRDRYRVEIRAGEIRAKDFYPEFVCNVCGFGFSVRPSFRWEHANRLFSEERKLRPPSNREENGKTPKTKSK